MRGGQGHLARCPSSGLPSTPGLSLRGPRGQPLPCLPSPSCHPAFPIRLLNLRVTKQLLDVRRKDLERIEWDLNRRSPPLRYPWLPLTAFPDCLHNSSWNLARTVPVA